MVKATANPILQLIRRTVEDGRVRELPDQDLVQRFHAQQDPAAFQALLRRHGPMVLDVCGGVLGNQADAEDAFQATFLILARKAGSIRKTASLGSWLHGVAYRTALKARVQAGARQKHEAGVPPRQPSEPDDLSWREVRQVLHEEVSALPERYRAPLVLCYLEGATQDTAAVRLNLAKSTLRERLERGLALLRTRLVRRGLGPAAVLITASWPALKASACLPASVVSSTIQAASLFAAGETAAPGLISVKVAALTEGVLRAMLFTKLKVATAVLFVTATLIGGGVQVLGPARAGAGTGAAMDVDKDARALPLPLPVLYFDSDEKPGNDRPPIQLIFPDGRQPMQVVLPQDKPQIKLFIRDGHWEGIPVVFVRDPSTGTYTALTRAHGIPVVRDHIEFQVKKLKEAKDDKAVREALKGLEESVRNMKDLLSLPGGPAEKKPDEKKPDEKKPADKAGAEKPRAVQVKRIQFGVDVEESDTQLQLHHWKLGFQPLPDGQSLPVRRFKLRLPPPADPEQQLEKLLERMGLAGQLVKVNALNARYAVEAAIPILKQFIDRDVERLKAAKDDKSIREAVHKLEESVQMLKELLSIDPPAEKTPQDKKPAKEKPAPTFADPGQAPLAIIPRLTEDMRQKMTHRFRGSHKLQFAEDVQLTFIPRLADEMRWRTWLQLRDPTDAK